MDYNNRFTNFVQYLIQNNNNNINYLIDNYITENYYSIDDLINYVIPNTNTITIDMFKNFFNNMNNEQLFLLLENGIQI